MLDVLQKLHCPPPVKKVADEEETEKQLDERKKTTRSNKPKKNRKKVSAKKAQSGPSQSAPSQSGGLDVLYKPGSFKCEFEKFVMEKKAEGLTHREAQEAWKNSPLREKLLAGLSESERKKRRFDK